jgi:hypothetical protein
MTTTFGLWLWHAATTTQCLSLTCCTPREKLAVYSMYSKFSIRLGIKCGLLYRKLESQSPSVFQIPLPMRAHWSTLLAAFLLRPCDKNNHWSKVSQWKTLWQNGKNPWLGMTMKWYEMIGWLKLCLCFLSFFSNRNSCWSEFPRGKSPRLPSKGTESIQSKSSAHEAAQQALMGLRFIG